VRPATRAHANLRSNDFATALQRYFETRARNKVPSLSCSTRDATVVELNPGTLRKRPGQAQPHAKPSTDGGRQRGTARRRAGGRSFGSAGAGAGLAPRPPGRAPPAPRRVPHRAPARPCRPRSKSGRRLSPHFQIHRVPLITDVLPFSTAPSRLRDSQPGELLLAQTATSFVLSTRRAGQPGSEPFARSPFSRRSAAGTAAAARPGPRRPLSRRKLSRRLPARLETQRWPNALLLPHLAEGSGAGSPPRPRRRPPGPGRSPGGG